MPSLLCKLGAVLLLASFTTTQAVHNIEIDFIFPREEMYTQSEIFPIALAVQNVTNDPSLGEHFVEFSITTYSDGITPGGVSLIHEDMTLLEGAGSDDYQIYVANANVTEWLHKWGPYDNFAVQVVILWPERRCGLNDGNSWALGPELRFNIETGRLSIRKYGEGIMPDVMDVPECPNFGSVVEISPNATHEDCRVIRERDNAEGGNPCAVVVDDSLKSSIVAAAESLAATAEAPSPTTYGDDDDDAAAGLRAPAGAALVAVLVLGCFTAWI